MREFKFRAWDKIHKDIKEVALISFVDRGVLLWTNTKNARATVERDFSDIKLMQGTGHKDKNGKEIYKGDIVRYHPEANAGIGRVVYLGSGLCVTDEFNGLLDDFATRGLEVIGNIFENPELIEEVKKNERI